jgi:hypothetical protein
MDEGDAPWQTKVQVMFFWWDLSISMCGSCKKWFVLTLGKVAVEGKGSPAVPTPLFPQRSEALTGVLHWNLGTRKTSLPEENCVSSFLHTFQWFIQQKIWDVPYPLDALDPSANPTARKSAIPFSLTHLKIRYPKIPWFGPHAPVSFLAIFGHPQFSTKPKAYDFVLHEL